MANVNKGEVGFTGLDGKKYVLSFSTNALCSLDEALGQENAFETILRSGKVTVKQHRSMFFVALRDRGRHTEIASEEAAAELVLYEEMCDLLTKAIQAQSPKAAAAAAAAEEEKAAKTNGAASPQKPGQESTGPAA